MRKKFEVHHKWPQDGNKTGGNAMCFSAEMSFAVAATLTVVGAATIKQAPSARWLPLAATSCIFAFQQAAEGILWMYLHAGNPTDPVAVAARHVYLFFAYCFWPVWTPLVLLLIESRPKIIRLLQVALVGGIAFATLAFTMNEGFGNTPQIVNKSIQYDAAPLWSILGYMAPVLLATLASSTRMVWTYGLSVTAALIFSYVYYFKNFTSIWCFYGAVISMIIFAIVRSNRLAELTEKEESKGL